MSTNSAEEWFSSWNLPKSNFGILQSSNSQRGIIGIWIPEIGLRLAGIENEELANACYDFLLRHEVKQFVTSQEMNDYFGSR